MKYLKSYKIFEDNDENDENNKIPEGFEYSWNDINNALVHLKDLGFEIDKPDGYRWDYREEAKKSYLADDSGDEIKRETGNWANGYKSKSNIELAKWAIYELRLKKSQTLKGMVRSSKYGYNDTMDYYLTEDPEKTVEIYQEIDAFCARFDKSYHNLTIKNNGCYLWLIVASAVSDDFVSKKLDDELNSEVNREIEKHIYPTLTNRFESKSYTKKFREDFIGPTLSKQKNGIAIKCFNWGSISKAVYNTNSAKFDSDVERILSNYNELDSYWGYKKYGYKAEFRELKEEDIAGLVGWEIEKARKHIGTKSIIVKFDYNKVFDEVKKKLSEAKG